jgi:hypothetical protein
VAVRTSGARARTLVRETKIFAQRLSCDLRQLWRENATTHPRRPQSASLSDGNVGGFPKAGNHLRWCGIVGVFHAATALRGMHRQFPIDASYFGRETKIFAQRLSSSGGRLCRENTPNGLRRPTAASLTDGHVGGFSKGGNHPGSCGLGGGGQSRAKPVSLAKDRARIREIAKEMIKIRSVVSGLER